MLKMTPKSEGSSSSNNKIGLLAKLRNLVVKPKNDADGLREVLEEYIEELEDDNQNPAIAKHEQALISNILKLRKTTVIDVMIPRADIAAIEVSANQSQLMKLLSERQFSRIPVFDDSLDEILGTVHIKDILSILASKKKLDLKSLIRPVPIVSPSLPVLDLLLKMQSDKKHMVMVVDEYGGIDGLATIGDVIESIVGEFDDEFDKDDDPKMIQKEDGSVIADARVGVEEFEEAYGQILSEEEREEVDTLGGLVFYTASRIPARGEVIKHDSGMVFEILEADQRRISSLRIRNIPKQNSNE
jgi:CBS domain containing-hemolysin-like protein